MNTLAVFPYKIYLMPEFSLSMNKSKTWSIIYYSCIYRTSATIRVLIRAFTTSHNTNTVSQDNTNRKARQNIEFDKKIYKQHFLQLI